MLTIQECFSDIDDPRINRTKEHPLINIIVIAICATICGADNWVQIESFGNSKRDWLEKFLDLPNGIPSHDTFGRVFARIDPHQFQTGFSTWVTTLSSTLIEQVVAIDGKKLRRSHDKWKGKDAIHMVSAWATEMNLVLGQYKVDEKSNEITAIPELLRILEVSGCIITIDAMGCQTDIAKQIIEKDADYVLSLKGNQSHLHKDTQEMFQYFEKQQFTDIEHDYYRTVDSQHGRLEIRECWAVPIASWEEHFRTAHKWNSLQSIVMVRSCRKVGNKEPSTEERYFISSLPPNAPQLLGAVRSHWGIENSLHWVLDIGFREDESRIRSGNAPENMAVLRHIALNLLKQDKSSKTGIQTKRLKCGWDEKYLLKVLSRGFKVN